MKFAFLGYSLEENWDAMTKSQQDSMLEDCFTYDSKLLKEGHLIGDGFPLQPSRTAKTLRWREGTVIVTDGPFAETKEQLGGVGLLEATDMAHAVALMSKHPSLHYGAVFEVRPIDEESLKRQTMSIAAFRTNAPAADPKSLRFVSLGYIDENGWGSISEDERAAMMTRCVAFDEARIKSGQWRSGIALQGARTAKTLRAKAGRVTITDGPFVETKEHLGGIVVLTLKDLNEGVATLREHPALPFGVAIELRAIDKETNRRWEIKQGRVNSTEEKGIVVDQLG
ncbi:MAG TPA: YciI family protein [Planctomycetaceae bacterium]|jgi:hypothetical protein|nr:YciI family protein [Planctomycetaceae bacterium]